MKEAFREYAIEKGFADQVVLDKDTYSELSEITGYFLDENGKWVVYDTDERGVPFHVKEYDLASDAYIDIASRFGYDLNINEIVTKLVSRCKKESS